MITSLASAHSSAGRRRGFTLVEMLVVVGIIAILATLLLSLAARGREKSRRLTCKNNLHQFALALQMYGDDNADYLPSGRRGDGREQLGHLSHETRVALIYYGGGEQWMDCPNMPDPLNKPGGVQLSPAAHLIGYQYLGGFSDWGAEVGWKSPHRYSDNPQLLTVTDLNQWSAEYRWTRVAHGARGALVRGSLFNNQPGGQSALELGAEGGYVADLTGGVQWRLSRQMGVYPASLPAAPLDDSLSMW